MPTDLHRKLTLTVSAALVAILFSVPAALAQTPAAPAPAQAEKSSEQPVERPEERPDQLRTLSRDELDIIKVLTMQERAWNMGDFDAFARGFKDSPDTIFITDQVRKGFDQMLAGYKKNYPNREAMGQLTYSELEPHILDAHVAVVIGKYHLDRSKKEGGNADGLFSDVFEKTDKGWKIIINHTT